MKTEKQEKAAIQQHIYIQYSQMIIISSNQTTSSAVAQRLRDASCLSVVSFNSTKRRAVFYCQLRRLQICHCVQLNALFCWLWRNVEASCHKHFVILIIKDIFIHLDMIHERDRHTHCHTQTPHDGIGRAYTQHRAEKIYKNYSEHNHETIFTVSI